MFDNVYAKFVMSSGAGGFDSRNVYDNSAVFLFLVIIAPLLNCYVTLKNLESSRTRRGI